MEGARHAIRTGVSGKSKRLTESLDWFVVKCRNGEVLK
jgi:hypothetical protein